MRAKLFRNGRSQAVRLPATCRIEGTEVEVKSDPVRTTKFAPLLLPRGFGQTVPVTYSSYLLSFLPQERRAQANSFNSCLPA